MNLQRFALPILLAAFVALALAYSVIVPLGEAPDEVSHWAYVQYLIEYRQLPPAAGAVLGEAHQPPLYYFLGALLTFWIPDQKFQVLANPDWQLGSTAANNLLLHTRQEAFPYQGGALAWHLVRLLSIALGALTVWATFQLARYVFPNDRAVAFVAAAFVAFLPQFTFLSAAANNDNLVIALSALSLLVFLRTPFDAPLSQFVLLGALLGLGVLTKISSFALWGAIGIAMLLRQEHCALRQRILRIFATFTTASAIISPWVIFNWVTFGDPINLTRWLSTVPRTAPMVLNDWILYLVRMDQSFWGKFGGASNLEMPPMTYAVLSVLLVVALLGVFLLLKDWRAGKLPSVTRGSLTFFALYWLILEVGHIRSVFALVGMDQARQVFAGLPALGPLLSAGILRLFQSQRLPTLIVTFGMGLVTLANGFNLADQYAPNFAVANEVSSSAIDFGKQIRVVDFRLDSQRLAPGGSISVQVTWQALRDLSEDYWLSLQLVSEHATVASGDGVPGAGRTTTDWWRAGESFESRHTILIPNDLAPGTYTLQLGLHPFGKWEWLPVRGQDMVPLAKIEVTAP